MGGARPLVQINGYTLSASELVYLEINQFDFYPTLTIRMKMTSGIFLSRHFPKDGDLISVFIRSFSDTLKPIRNDYFITEITSMPSNDAEGGDMLLIMRGILHIPLLYAETCMGIKDTTSFDALVQVTSNMQLGFASNESSTDDNQNWICPYITHQDFIENIVSHSWKDDSSFFYAFIDCYYTFNFLNMNKLFIVKDNEEPKKGIMRGTVTTDMYDTTDVSTSIVQNVLTNAQDMSATNYYYNSLRMINKSGEINILNGYKRYVHFFEKSLETDYRNTENCHTEIFVDPMVTPDAASKKVLLKGRAGEDNYLYQIKHKWQGVQYGTPNHNVHQYYKFAEIHNFQNIQEMSKLNLQITLPNPNFNFYRGQRVPFVLTVSQNPERVKIAGNEADKPRVTGATIDRFLSGQYIILGTKLIYNQDSTSANKEGRYKQELKLGRREWTMPDSVRKIDENDPEKWSSEKPL